MDIEIRYNEKQEVWVIERCKDCYHAVIIPCIITNYKKTMYSESYQVEGRKPDWNGTKPFEERVNVDNIFIREEDAQDKCDIINGER